MSTSSRTTSVCTSFIRTGPPSRACATPRRARRPSAAPGRPPPRRTRPPRRRASLLLQRRRRRVRRTVSGDASRRSGPNASRSRVSRTSDPAARPCRTSASPSATRAHIASGRPCSATSRARARSRADFRPACPRLLVLPCVLVARPRAGNAEPRGDASRRRAASERRRPGARRPRRPRAGRLCVRPSHRPEGRPRVIDRCRSRERSVIRSPNQPSSS